MRQIFSLTTPPLELLAGKKTAILADAHVASLYGRSLASVLGARLFLIPRGERAKTRRVKERIEDQLLQEGFGKDAQLVALGGGSTLDLAGFIASTYLRGISLILIPTTLLAIVDASIGGKTGINTGHGKNLIGSFYPPKCTLIDWDVLRTLPKKEHLNGVSEILKMKLVYDSSIEAHDAEKAALAKMAIVEQDPFETGLRRILNFGHTIGHALENACQYRISHGRAVAIGCLAESHLSMRLGYLAGIQSILPLFPQVRLPKSYTREKLLGALSMDKKKEAGAVRFVLIDRIGHALPFDGAYCRPVSLEELTPTLDWMEERHG